MKKLVYSAVISMMMLSVIGCGGGDSTESQTNINTGYLIDAPIAGVSYSCGGIVGTTDAQGKFECSTLPVTFSVGTLMLGSIIEFTADNNVYPQDLLDISRSNFTDTKLIALVRFLQSLDDDGSYEDVINIPKETSDKFSNYSVLFNDSKLDEYISVAGKNLVSETQAITHLQGVMGNIENDENQEDNSSPSATLLEFNENFLQENDANRYYALTCSNEVDVWNNEVATIGLEERHYSYPSSINGVNVSPQTMVYMSNGSLYVEVTANSFVQKYTTTGDVTLQADFVEVSYSRNNTALGNELELWFQVGYQSPGSSESRYHCQNGWRDIDQIWDTWYDTRGGENSWMKMNYQLVGAQCSDRQTFLDAFDMMQLEIDEVTKDDECGVYKLNDSRL